MWTISNIGVRFCWKLLIQLNFLCIQGNLIFENILGGRLICLTRKRQIEVVILEEVNGGSVNI